MNNFNYERESIPQRRPLIKICIQQQQNKPTIQLRGNQHGNTDDFPNRRTGVIKIKFCFDKDIKSTKPTSQHKNWVIFCNLLARFANFRILFLIYCEFIQLLMEIIRGF